MADNTVKEERERLGWTQEKLSEEAGIPRSTLQKIERRAYSPNVDHALGIADALGQPVEAIFTRNRSRIRLKRKAEKEPVPPAQAPA
ncbi:helix-turn-helix transcriptional regulator [Deinococcus sp. 6GRE01]|uniref:helix-turn-helix transcriptional regulator n=1 Tax=Deinococcus sp. 6GRE01 TaxID=2745873 RepID=UPI001E33AAFB|nr:helix-turn-helix transcriptional regulator [Deinococcus sp. 6GRE01]MCD0155973.1 helix-turn-helix transcriptional regulator [Deinococcus sp. 6GRE01]